MMLTSASGNASVIGRPRCSGRTRPVFLGRPVDTDDAKITIVEDNADRHGVEDGSQHASGLRTGSLGALDRVERHREQVVGQTMDDGAYGLRSAWRVEVAYEGVSTTDLGRAIEDPVHPFSRRHACLVGSPADQLLARPAAG